MKAEKGKTNGQTNCITIRVSADILRHPEDLPLTLRNIVVLLAGDIPPGERKAFDAYMRVVYELEKTFASLRDI
jgi:hypothetical protein